MSNDKSFALDNIFLTKSQRYVKDSVSAQNHTEEQISFLFHEKGNQTLKEATHSLIDTFEKNGKQEDSCNRWGKVTGDGFSVDKELTTLGSLHHRNPCYAHTNQGQDKHSV